MASRGHKSLVPGARILRYHAEQLKLALPDDETEWGALVAEAAHRTRAVAAYLAHGKEAYYQDRYRDWLEMARDLTGLEKRQIDSYARAGAFLLNQVRQYPVLAQVWSVDVLDNLARLAPEGLGAFLTKHPDLPTMQRTEVRRLVKLYLGLQQEAGEPAQGQKLAETGAKTDASPQTLWRWARQYLREWATVIDVRPAAMTADELAQVREFALRLVDTADEAALAAHGVQPPVREQYAARLARAQAGLAAAGSAGVSPAPTSTVDGASGRDARAPAAGYTDGGPAPLPFTAGDGRLPTAADQ